MVAILEKQEQGVNEDKVSQNLTSEGVALILEKQIDPETLPVNQSVSVIRKQLDASGVNV